MSFKFSFFIFCCFISMNVSAFDPDDDLFSTNLCAHKYDSEGKYYFCDKKITKVNIGFKFDDYYSGDGKIYAEYSKKIILNEIYSIRNKVKQFKFDVVNHDELKTIPLPSKNESLFYFQFSRPNFSDREIAVTIFASIDGRFSVISNKIKISGDRGFSDDLKKDFKDNYSCFIHLYSSNI